MAFRFNDPEQGQKVAANIPELYECTVHKIKQTTEAALHKGLDKSINEKIFRYGFSKHKHILAEAVLPEIGGAARVALDKREDQRCLSRARRKVDEVLGRFQRCRTVSRKAMPPPLPPAHKLRLFKLLSDYEATQHYQ
jgi:hypothetical protein